MYAQLATQCGHAVRVTIFIVESQYFEIGIKWETKFHTTCYQDDMIIPSEIEDDLQMLLHRFVTEINIYKAKFMNKLSKE